MDRHPGIRTSVLQDRDVELPEIEELERQYASTPSDGKDVGSHIDATLTISRNAAHDVQDRQVTLWLDDERWDILRYGHTLTRPVSPGRHKVKGHNTLFGTTFEFEAKPGEHVRLRCVNGVVPGGALLMLLIGWAMLRVRIERDVPHAGDHPAARPTPRPSSDDPMASGLL
jgi:hypothetical protein